MHEDLIQSKHDNQRQQELPGSFKIIINSKSKHIQQRNCIK
jgi:hypothetical protein